MTRSLFWEDIEAGAELPAITHELSLLRLIAFVRATGLYDYVHFDRDYAQLVGARDVFISTPHVAGLFNRLLTDWTGPEGVLRSLSFSMNGQSCSGDLLTITGRVDKKYRNEQGDFLVDVTGLTIGHILLPNAATATATMAVPSRTQPKVRLVVPTAEKPAAKPGENIPDSIKSVLGKPKAIQRRIRPISADAIHLLCEALEDWNPLYWDKSYADKSAYGGIIAPPTANFFGIGSSVNVGLGYLKPGEQVPEPVKRGLTGLPLLQALRDVFLKENSAFKFADYPEVVVAGMSAEYVRPVMTDDLLRVTQEIADCSPLKKTKLGEGHFVTILENTYNQRDELVKAFTKKAFYYRPSNC